MLAAVNSGLSLLAISSEINLLISSELWASISITSIPELEVVTGSNAVDLTVITFTESLDLTVAIQLPA